MTDREIMQQALEALENGNVPTPENVGKNLDAITALRERLAQLEQKPVPWESFFKRYCPWLEQPEQEPIKESSVTHSHLWIGELWRKEKNT